MIVKSVEKKENSAVSFVIELDSNEFEAAVQKAYLKNKSSITVPGFRKGKAPRMVVEGMFGSDVFYEDAISEVSQSAFIFGVEQQSLKNVGMPAVTNADISEEKALTLTFETAVYPEVTLGQYKGLEAVKKPVVVEEAEIDAELERVRARNARIITAERPAQNGDTANIDFEGFLDGVPFDGGKGEGHDLVLGSGSFIPGFEEQVVGMSAGEEKDIDVTFPENYAEELAGKATVFHVEVNAVKESQLPELDDEFAKDISEFDTLDEYKASVRENLEKARENEYETEFRGSLMEKAIANMTAEVPDAMVEEKQDSMIQEYAQSLMMQGYSLEQYLGMLGMEESVFRASARPAALQQVQSELLLAKIAEEEAVEISDEELDAEFERIADNYGVELDVVKKAVTTQALTSDLKMSKASKIIYDSATAVEPSSEQGTEDAAAEEPAAE